MIEVLAHRLFQRALDLVVEDDAPDGGGDVAAVQPLGAVVRRVVQADELVLVGELGLLGGAEHVDLRLIRRRVHRLQPSASSPYVR